MKLSKKKLLSFILALIICVGVIPSEVFSSAAEYIMTVAAATDDVTASGTCGADGDNLTWTLTSDGTLTITGTGEMKDYYSARVNGVELRAPWYSSNVTSVVIEDGVTSIGEYAFYKCTGITSVTIGNSVATIGYYAFGNCTSLTSVTIGDSVATIGYRAFYNCTSLTDVTIPDSVTNIGEWAFYGCTSLMSIAIPDSVTTIDMYAFVYCTSLESITIGDGVTSIGYGAFYNTAYYNDESNWKDQVLYINNWLIDANFQVRGDYTIKSGTVGLACEAFLNCPSLVSITIPDSVATIGDRAFVACDDLTAITVVEDNKAYCSEDGVLFNKDMTTLIVYPAGKTDNFYTIPDSVTKIEDYAFYYCTSLTNITIHDSVTTIGLDAFYGCTSLESVTIGDSVTTIGSEAFYICKSLTSITIPASVTTIGYDAFYYCTSLTKIYFEGDAPSIEYAFAGVTAAAYYPAGNDTWTDDVMQDYGGTITWVAYDVNSDDSGDAVASGACGDNLTWTFNGTTLTVSGTGDMYDFSAGEAPWNSYCDSIVIIEVEDGVTSVGAYAFYGCSSMMFLTLGDSITSIGEYAFCDCTGLLNIISMGNNVASIGDYAFYGCTQLSTVNYDGFEEEWNSISIGSNNSCLTDATIFYKEDEETVEVISNEIIFDVDQWSFSNSDSYFGDTYYISDEDLEKLESQLLEKDWENIKTWLEIGYDWGGSCYGMAATVILFKMTDIQPSDLISDATTVYSIEKDGEYD